MSEGPKPAPETPTCLARRSLGPSRRATGGAGRARAGFSGRPESGSGCEAGRPESAGPAAGAPRPGAAGRPPRAGVRQRRAVGRGGRGRAGQLLGRRLGVIVPAARFAETCRFLRDQPGCQFDYLSDLTAVDWPTRDKRFDLVACLYSTALRHRVRVKARVAEGEAVPSVTGIWPAANWLEREVYDMFGVTFTGHRTSGAC